MPVEVQDVLQRLEFFALQQRHSKLCIKQKTFVNANSWTGTVYRIFHSETSADTIQEIKGTIKDYGLCVQHHPTFQPLLAECLERARKGIYNLFEIYQHKPGIIAELKVIISMINIFIKADEDCSADDS